MEPVLKIYQGDTKCDIRQKVWNYIEEKNLANFPRPVYNRIPNFKGAAHACNWLIDLQEFRSSRVIKVNPDRPQQQARFHTLDGAHQACSKVSSLESFTKTTVVKVDPDKPLEGVRLATLQAKKTLIVPTPRLRTGLFNRIVPPKGATKQELHVCSTSQGIKEFSVPIGLDDKVQVDLVVVGSVAVSDKGYRIGKGEGFADMEYAMMVFMGAVGESTVVVTIVHDCQVMDIPDELHESHDLTVDFILTPTRIIKTECKQSRSQGIIWSKLDNGVLQKIPILKKLRTLAQNTGKDFALKTPSAGQEKSEQSISLEQFPCNIKPVLKWEPNSDPKGEQKHKHLDLEGDKHARHRFPKCSVPSLYLGSIPTGLSVSELENLLREQDAAPLRVTWHGAHHRALLEYSDNSDAERALAALQNVSINGHTLCAQPVRNQRSSWRPQKNTKMAGRGGY